MYKPPVKTLFLGKNLIFMPECHSTNDVALQLSHNPATPEGTLVITAYQTAGRGQRGNTWQTEPNLNLTFSFIIKPGFLAVQDQFYLNIFVSLGICDYITQEVAQKVHIKWPNDVLIGKKVCGILIENQIQGSKISNSIVGIGLNINQQTFVIDTATSLSSIGDKQYNLPEVLEGLLHQIEKRYLQLREGKLEELKKDYLQNLYWLNEPHTFISNDKSFEGTILGIDEIGRLKIDTENGVKVFGLKEVKYGY